MGPTRTKTVKIVISSTHDAKVARATFELRERSDLK